MFTLGTLGLLLAMLFGLVAPPAGAQVGSCAPGEFESQFFNNTSLSGAPALTRCDASVAFDWGGGSPAPEVNSDNFSARFTAQQDFAAGWHSFNVRVDDGFRLYVDGVLLMESWQQQPATTYSATQEMTAGSHQVVIEYVEVGGAAVIQYNATPTTAPPSTVQFAGDGSAYYYVYEHGGSAEFTITRSGDTTNRETVEFNTYDYSASDGYDYTGISGTAVFQPGVTSTSFDVTIIDDLDAEGDEIVYLALSDPSGTSLGYPSEGYLFIVDNDVQPGSGNETQLSITQTDSPDPTPATENTTYALTVTNNSLFTATDVSVLDTLPSNSGLVSLGPGCVNNFNNTVTCSAASLLPGASISFSITVVASVVGSNTNTATVSSSTPESFILDNTSTEETTITVSDDSTYYFSDATAMVVEGDEGSLLVLRGGTVTPETWIQKIMGERTAGSDVDYVDESPWTPNASYVQFAAGATSAPFGYYTIDDNVYEGDETFTIILGQAGAGRVVEPSQAVVTIVDNDPVPMMLLGDVAHTEGDVGASYLIFNLVLSNPSIFEITGDYMLTDGSAEAPGDFDGTGGSFAIPAGATSTTVAVPIQGDYFLEEDETFSIELSNVANVDAGSSDFTATGTITDDDDAHVDLAITKTHSVDPAPLNGSLAYTLTVENLTAGTVANAVTISDALPAEMTYVSSSGDCTYDSAGGLASCSSLAGGASKVLTITVTPTSVGTFSNTASVSTSSSEPNQANNADTETTGVQTSGSFHFSSDEYNGDEGTVATITVSRLGGAGGEAAVDYATSNGTATADGDYIATSGTLYFAAGEQIKSFTVLLGDDAIDENAETITVSLSNPVRGVFITSDPSPTTTLTINDTDPPPVLSASDVTQNEGNSGTSPMTFAVTLSAASGRTVTVEYATGLDGAAQPPGDFTATSGTLTFLPGETTKTVEVSIVGDTTVEPDERLFLQLDSPTNATLTDSGVTGMILNDDTAAADVSLTKTAPATAILASEFNYTLVATNNGPSVASSTSVQDALPPEVVLVSAATTSGSCAGIDTVSCDLGPLASGASATITIRVKATLVGNAANQATVAAPEADPNTANNTAGASTVIAAAPPVPPAPPTEPPPPVTSPAPPTEPTPPVGPGAPCKLTLTSNYIFHGLVTFVGVRVTRDDAPVANVRVFSKHSWSPKITVTRTNASGYVEYHFRTVTPGASVEFIADCDGNGLKPLSLRNLRTPGRSASLAQEPAGRVTNPGLLSTRTLTKVGAFIGQGQRTPASQGNCNTVSVTSWNLKANRRGNVTVKVRFAGQPVNAAAVMLSGVGVSAVKATRLTGNVSFTVKPTTSGILSVRVPNFASCSSVENLAVAAR